MVRLNICLFACLVGYAAALTCPPNEVENRCGNNCEPTCDENPRRCDRSCKGPPACVCIEGLVRELISGECVHPMTGCLGVGARAAIPGAATVVCGPDEVLNECGNHCQRTCANKDIEPLICTFDCREPACECKEGLVRHYDGSCVRPNECPTGTRKAISEKDLPTCGPNEFVDMCGNRCEPNCATRELGPQPCPYICDPPACHCKKGYFRDDASGNCVTAEQCGPTRGALPSLQCGPNEYANECGNLCEPKCEDIGKPGKPCPTICNPPACHCNKGTYRDTDGRCVSAAVCGARGRAAIPEGTDEDICIDDHVHCSYWSAIGHCKDNPLYMKLHCPKSCNVCGPGAIACRRMRDRSGKDTCKVWEKIGYCNENKAVKYFYCQKTCLCN